MAYIFPSDLLDPHQGDGKAPLDICAKVHAAIGTKAMGPKCLFRTYPVTQSTPGLKARLGSHVFDIAIDPSPSRGQPQTTISELAADAFLLMVAGTDTTADALVCAIFNVLSNPAILQTLRTELQQAMPKKDMTLDWASLEQLPYLHATIKETVRLSYGVPNRLPRLVPATGAVFCGQKFPAGTVVSCANYVYSHDESAFEDSFAFRPERWIEGDQLELERRLVSFSRGSRSCPGVNLAYANLHLVLAALFRRFDMQLFETSAREMQWKDSFGPLTKRSSESQHQGDFGLNGEVAKGVFERSV